MNCERGIAQRCAWQCVEKSSEPDKLIDLEYCDRAGQNLLSRKFFTTISGEDQFHELDLWSSYCLSEAKKLSVNN